MKSVLRVGIVAMLFLLLWPPQLIAAGSKGYVLDFAAICNVENNYGDVAYSVPCRIQSKGEMADGSADWWIRFDYQFDFTSTPIVTEESLVGRALSSGGQRWVFPSFGTVEFWPLDGKMLGTFIQGYWHRVELRLTVVQTTTSYFSATTLKGPLTLHIWHDPDK